MEEDAGEIIAALSTGPATLILTTNATCVHEFADTLQEAGVQELNISLDTLQANKFMLLTRRD